jgi:ATP-binding cassette subfamily F protein uup
VPVVWPAQVAAKRQIDRGPRGGVRKEDPIVAAQSELELRQAEAGDPEIASDAAELQSRYAALARARSEVDRLYSRWSELEGKRG